MTDFDIQLFYNNHLKGWKSKHTVTDKALLTLSCFTPFVTMDEEGKTVITCWFRNKKDYNSGFRKAIDLIQTRDPKQISIFKIELQETESGRFKQKSTITYDFEEVDAPPDGSMFAVQVILNIGRKSPCKNGYSQEFSDLVSSMQLSDLGFALRSTIYLYLTGCQDEIVSIRAADEIPECQLDT